MHPLIERCLRGEPDAWEEFWLTLDNVAARPICRLLVRAGFGDRAEDLVQDMYLHLRENDYERLRSFRGETAQELKLWLVRASANFALDWLDKATQERKHERESLAGLAEAESREALSSMTEAQKRKARGHLEKRDASGPSEDELDVWLREREKIEPEDVAKLRRLIRPDESSSQGGEPPRGPEPSVSARTLRDWARQLFEKYRRLLRHKS